MISCNGVLKNDLVFRPGEEVRQRPIQAIHLFHERSLSKDLRKRFVKLANGNINTYSSSQIQGEVLVVCICPDYPPMSRTIRRDSTRIEVG
jgi:hypothetical protein